MSNLKSENIFLTKTQAALVKRLPKVGSDSILLWERSLQKHSLDLETIKRLWNGEKYEVIECEECRIKRNNLT